MKRTHEVVTKVIQEMQYLRQQFENGEVYHNLSLKMNQIPEQVVYFKTRKPLAALEDSDFVVEKITTMAEQLKNGAVPKISDADLDYLLENLASTDLKVRDKGIYFLFNDLLHVEALTDTQMRRVKDQLLAEDFLFYHILEPQNDGVFKRSFSVLILSALLYADRTIYHIFTTDELIDLEDRLTAYIILERDGRGYVDQKGWAHVYTHVANAFDEIMFSDLNRANKLFFLTALLLGYRRMSDPLIFGEDHRLAMAFSYITNKDDFYADYFVHLLKDWQAEIMLARPAETQQFWNHWYNRSRLMQAMLVRGDFPSQVLEYLREIMINY